MTGEISTCKVMFRSKYEIVVLGTIEEIQKGWKSSLRRKTRSAIWRLWENGSKKTNKCCLISPLNREVSFCNWKVEASPPFNFVFVLVKNLYMWQDFQKTCAYIWSDLDRFPLRSASSPEILEISWFWLLYTPVAFACLVSEHSKFGSNVFHKQK